jgi:hypothetical protein
MTAKTVQTKSWIITKQPKGLTVPKEPHLPGFGRLFCSMNRQEMETEARRLNEQEDGWMYFVDPQA